MTVFLKFNRKFSNHLILFRSRWLVGSSSKRISGFPNKAWANNTLTFWLPSKSFIYISWYSVVIPKPFNMISASLSAFQPSMSANSPSSSPSLIPSSSLKSALAYSFSFSCMISNNLLLPMITVSTTLLS